MKDLIYVLEDEDDMARILRRTLTEHGFDAEVFRAIAPFNEAVAKRRPDMALIDLGLPDGDGMSVVSDLMRREGIASIIVTGRSNLTDRVVGLELGADDYIVKPFEGRELVARVRALLRRVGNTSAPAPAPAPAAAPAPAPAAQQPGQRIARFAGWEVDFSACTLTDDDGRVVDLSAAETELLRVFAKSAGRVLSRSQLLDIESRDLEPYDRSIDARISRLRRKLRDNVQSPKIIRTVYGAGYVFAADVEWL